MNKSALKAFDEAINVVQKAGISTNWLQLRRTEIENNQHELLGTIATFKGYLKGLEHGEKIDIYTVMNIEEILMMS